MWTSLDNASLALFNVSSEDGPSSAEASGSDLISEFSGDASLSVSVESSDDSSSEDSSSSEASGHVSVSESSGDASLAVSGESSDDSSSEGTSSSLDP